ncbi:40S ribosomal protein S4-2 [Abeliophyllum distichum]|uniref:40S ribosomal protein S4-2 n=1 Tax=Abeliophyllum distichum TaxID=126358 RepID=A0ABD1VVX3_9LAMI
MPQSIGCWTNLVVLLHPNHLLDPTNPGSAWLLAVDSYYAQQAEIRPTLLVLWMLFLFRRPMRISACSMITKGRFRLHSVRDEEAKFKLCKVRSIQFGKKGIPYLNTYDGRTIRYPDPLIKANDTIKFDLETNKIVDFIKFDVGNVVMVTGGRNRGRVGVIKNREKHKGSFETIHVQDAAGHEFATRLSNVFTIGKGTKPWVSLPKGKGIKLSIIEEARKRLAAQSAAPA